MRRLIEKTLVYLVASAVLTLPVLFFFLPAPPASAHTGNSPGSWAPSTPPGPTKVWRDPKLQIANNNGALVVGTTPMIGYDVSYSGGCGSTSGMSYTTGNAYAYYVNAAGQEISSAGMGGGFSLTGAGNCNSSTGIFTQHVGDPSGGNTVPSGTTHLAIVVCLHSSSVTANAACSGQAVGMRMTTDVNVYPNSGLVLTGQSVCDGVRLDWTYTGGLDRFEIQRSNDGGSSYTTIDSFDGSLRSYVDSPLKNGVRRWYRMRAASGSVVADWSNVVAVTAGCASPSPSASPSGAPAWRAPPAAYLTCREAAALVITYMPSLSSDQYGLYLAVFWAESSLNYHAVSYDGSSYGWTQINVEVWDRTKDDMMDPVKATQQADEVNVEHSEIPTIKAWDAYTKGMHTKFMDRSQACVDEVATNPGAFLPGEGTPDDVDQVTDPDTVDEDGEGGISCGWSLFCWIKKALYWAFVPGDGMAAAWADFKGTVEARPPFSLVGGVYDWIVVQEGECGVWNNCDTNYVSHICFGEGLGDEYDDACLDGPGGSLLELASNPYWGTGRTIVEAAMWGGFMFAIFRKMRGAVGDHTEADTGGSSDDE